MTKFEIIAVGTSIIIAVTGFTLGYIFDGVYFSRSGSLIVVVGVIFGLLDLPSRLADIDSWVKKQASIHKQEILNKNKTDGVSEQQSEQAYDDVIDEMTTVIKSKAKKRRQKIVRIEGAILVVGTLIWGFGDLINKAPCCTS